MFIVTISQFFQKCIYISPKKMFIPKTVPKKHRMKRLIQKSIN